MISLIMSVYNVDKYLEKCIESIFNQTYKDFELIVINDGSTDHSKDIILKYLDIYDNIIYLEQENKGVSVARNLGLDIANGEYIMYIDSDDFLDNKTLELMFKKMQEDNSDLVIIGHEEIYEDVNGINTDVKFNIDENRIYTGYQVANKMLRGEIIGVVWNKLYKTELLKKENFRFEKGRYTQDWYPSFKHICNVNRVSFINKGLYKYRIRSTSTTSKKNEKRLEDYHYAVKNIINYFENSSVKFEKESLQAFKAITFNKIISLFFEINKSSESSVYDKFNKSKYLNYNESIISILKLNNIEFKTKLYIIAWKLRLYKYLIYLEVKYRKIKILEK